MNIGITVQNGNAINFNTWLGNGTIMAINNTSVNTYQPTTINSSLTTTGTINPNGDNIQFPSTLNKFKINLWGTNLYGLGIASGTLQYTSQGYHQFYNGTTVTTTIDGSGNVSVPNNISSAKSLSNKYVALVNTISYISNWNGTSYSGWFIALNDFWLSNGSSAYLTLCFNLATTNSYCWFGRIFLNSTYSNSQVSITTDYKNPSSGAYQFNTSCVFDGSGNNVLWISQTFIMTENLQFKIYG